MTAEQALAAQMRTGNWVTEAACNPQTAEDFFPARVPGNRSRNPHQPDRVLAADALAACRVCPVQLACLQHALDNGERNGVWGGLTEGELAELREGAA